MKTRIAVSVVASAWIALAGVVGAQDAELNVLRKYVGKWEATFTVQDGENEMKADVVARWVLGKRYVQQTSTVAGKPGDEAFGIMTLMTYDSDAGSYRRWTFTSAGKASEETGTWDAETKTLTWTGEDPKNGNTTTVSATFKEKDEEHWSIVTETSAGKMVSLIAGVNRRVKKAE